GELQLLDIGNPALAEILPGQHVDAARAEQRPHRDLDRPGIRAGDNADPPVGGDAEDRARALDDLDEPLQPHRGAMRAPGQRRRPAGPGPRPPAWRRGPTRNPGWRAAGSASSHLSAKVRAPQLMNATPARQLAWRHGADGLPALREDSAILPEWASRLRHKSF